MANTLERQSSEHIWDCGSSLYDSFELRSVERLLDSAIASKSLSMPHLSGGRRHSLQPPKLPGSVFRWIIRAFLKFKRCGASKRSVMGGDAILGIERYWDRSPALYEIPKVRNFRLK
ncbi:Avr9/Cf-9 rapidly elicited protein 194 [Striga asiatica]|uniref:Avr9/Cf-9 rapidly elicited protein 194 n=1 Tax=Striga asiatica TaxID=4170 RepID=A0A5A7PK68_STRAF|nr:Avr9/Cf-9 rapidly elicited protein 194 [Striga asiatica]